MTSGNGNRESQRGRRFTLWWFRLMIVSVFSVFALLVLTLLLEAQDVLSVAIGLPFLAVCVLAAIYSARIASIDLAEQEIVIHGFLPRTRRIAWSDIRNVGATRPPGALLPWRVPYFELSDGSTVRADEIRSLRKGSIVDDVVGCARGRLAG